MEADLQNGSEEASMSSPVTQHNISSGYLETSLNPRYLSVI